MRLYQNLIAGGIILGALVGCNGKKYNKPLEETLIGEPISVQVAGGTHGVQSVSTMIRLSDGKYQLCSAGEGWQQYYHLHRLTDAAAIIESEIRDDDSEPVEITGYRVGDRFRMELVSANGYSVNLAQ